MRHGQVALVDGLTKVTPRWSLGAEIEVLHGWQREAVSFQVAWRPAPTTHGRPSAPLRIHVTADGRVRYHAVDLVPVQVPVWEEHGDGYLTDEPGLLPDVLRPLVAQGDTVEVANTHVGWHAVWVDVDLPTDSVGVRVWADDELILERTLPVTVVQRDLPDHGVAFTQWFHADCLATHYEVDTWSEEHWRVIEGQIRAAREMGVTMLLTSVWTPPLDTAVGTYRRTTQLLDIARDGDTYTFGTERLDRWLDLLQDAGIAQVEVPHLFTQWGARHAPRFDVVVDGELTQLFGWDTPATAPEYQEFLAALIPFLKDYFEDRIGLANTVFHISDEPNEHHVETYRAARESVRELLTGCRVLDALSHPEYTELVDVPVVATDAVPAFRAAGMEPDWVYHCVVQSWDVANRFIAQESIRTRALGWQLYKANAGGFLHWALNFYSKQLSLGPVNPFAETSAGGGFISGDAFVVYPGPDGDTWPSLRHRLIRDAFDDLAAARGAEAVLGRYAVLRIIDPQGDLDYDAGWVSADAWQARRRALDEAVVAALA